MMVSVYACGDAHTNSCACVGIPMFGQSAGVDECALYLRADESAIRGVRRGRGHLQASTLHAVVGPRHLAVRWTML